MLSHDVVSCRSLQSDEVRYRCLWTIGTHEGLRTQIITNLLAACIQFSVEMTNSLTVSGRMSSTIVRDEQGYAHMASQSTNPLRLSKTAPVRETAPPQGVVV
jgi:hypothetical protein